ncbi:hypothetical protein DFH06DRAFT_989344 [Mycena polygramma]|nr:hypothetical protein DFH06DRAFT_989344 [Mycena polygramma]
MNLCQSGALETGGPGQSCEALAAALIRHGLFPASPVNPRYVLSMQELHFWRRFAEQDAPSSQSIAAAYQAYYNDLGFSLDVQSEAQLYPSRQLIGKAIYWHDNLRNLLDKQLEVIARDAPAPMQGLNSPGRTQLHDVSIIPQLHVDRAHRELAQRCPACFSLQTWGRSFNIGGDIQCEVDATFSLPHNKAAGTGHQFTLLQPSIFISKSEVDDVGRRIDNARRRGRPPKQDNTCAASHRAAKENGWRPRSEKFDETGVMVCSCRHGIPLLAASIDTPGEQQKYVVALFEHLMQRLPASATLVLLYDIACVVDRSLNMASPPGIFGINCYSSYDITSRCYRERLLLCTSLMHAYGHQWRCQLLYNPRIRPGIGLTDGEGVERIWSRLRSLISTTRCSSASRRLWALERQLLAIGEQQRRNLGKWIQKRSRKLQQELNDSRNILIDCRVPIVKLREEWINQQNAQASQQGTSPNSELLPVDRLYLDLIKIAADSDSNWEILEFQVSVSSPESSVLDQAAVVDERYAARRDAMEKEIQGLGLDPNFLHQFRGVCPEFLRKLLMARLLKQKLRMRLIDNFFEYDRLAQSKSGKAAALGNQVYVQTTRAIARRKPVLVAALKAYNHCCDDLTKLFKPTYMIPLPSQLPTDLNSLRHDPTLMDDVWIHRSQPRWLEKNFRSGIQAMLKADHCVDEHNRICREAHTIQAWAREERYKIECAMNGLASGRQWHKQNMDLA